MNFFQKLKASVIGAVQSIIAPWVSKEEPESGESILQPEDPMVTRMKEQNRASIERANQLMNELEENGVQDYSDAYKKAMESGGYFDIDSLDSKEAIIREALRAEEFLHSDDAIVSTATLQMKEDIGVKTVDDLKTMGYDLYRTREEQDNIVKAFWDAVDRVREEEDIGANLTAAQYSRDQAYGYAFNIWVQNGYDQEELKNALKQFLTELNVTHEATVKATKGVATFNGDEDIMRNDF